MAEQHVQQLAETLSERNPHEALYVERVLWYETGRGRDPDLYSQVLDVPARRKLRQQVLRHLHER